MIVLSFIFYLSSNRTHFCLHTSNQIHRENRISFAVSTSHREEESGDWLRVEWSESTNIYIYRWILVRLMRFASPSVCQTDWNEECMKDWSKKTERNCEMRKWNVGKWHLVKRARFQCEAIKYRWKPNKKQYVKSEGGFTVDPTLAHFALSIAKLNRRNRPSSYTRWFCRLFWCYVYNIWEYMLFFFFSRTLCVYCQVNGLQWRC